MQAELRRGIVLIELITIVAVVFLLIALQIPAILAARENARRAQCTNNLKQLFVGTHNYHSTFGTFPMSAVAGKGRGLGGGCFVSILPFIEQVALFNTYNFDLEDWSSQNATSMNVKVMTYICPSNKNIEMTLGSEVRDHHGKGRETTVKYGPLHYGANWGGVREASGADVMKAYPGSHLGVMLTVVDPDAKSPTKNISVADITDGTSYTIAFAERKASYGFGVGGWSGSEFDVYTSPHYTGEDPKLMRAFTGSFHPEVINVAYADGSVKQLKPNVDQKIWYALTTRAMGEKVVVP